MDVTKAVQVHQHGGPEVLKIEDVKISEPAPGQVLIRQTSIGINYIDVYYRSGVYKPPSLPFIPGVEAAGEVVKSGLGVSMTAGRVAYAGPLGAYAEHRLIDEKHLVPLPDDIDDAIASTSLLKALTAHCLLHRVFKVEKGHTILVQAAAGGVGHLLCQWAAAKGATVIGTVSTEDKAEQARKDGCHHPIIYTREDFVQRVMEITEGRGVNVVYDSVGKATFQRSLTCLAKLGHMVSFGQSSGYPDPVHLSSLARGSLTLSRPTMMDYNSTREELLRNAGEVFDAIRSGMLRVRVGQTYPLAEVARAHEDLEARRTTGTSRLVVTA